MAMSAQLPRSKIVAASTETLKPAMMKLSAGQVVPVTSDVTVDSPESRSPGLPPWSRVVNTPLPAVAVTALNAVIWVGAVLAPARSDPHAQSGSAPSAAVTIATAVRWLFPTSDPLGMPDESA
jgi:hypothetical protein